MQPENPVVEEEADTPDLWDREENPPYVYYLFYMYANLAALNQFRYSTLLSTYSTLRDYYSHLLGEARRILKMLLNGVHGVLVVVQIREI